MPCQPLFALKCMVSREIGNMGTGTHFDGYRVNQGLRKNLAPIHFILQEIVPSIYHWTQYGLRKGVGQSCLLHR